MQFTNRKNLPEIMVRAVTNDPYDKGESDYSATELIKPAFQRMLQKKHADEIVEDVADRLWSLFGSAHHYILERAADGTDIVEIRVFANVAGMIISCQLDHYRDGVISDWKLTSAYKVKKAITEQDFDDWEQQLNIQACIARANGYAVKALFIGAMVRDWTPYAHKTEEGYPDQIEYIEIPMWENERVEQFIIERMEDHADPSPCSQEERWQPDPTFAVMKKGGVRALKVESSIEDAFAWCETKGFVKLIEREDADANPNDLVPNYFVPARAEDLLMMVDDEHEIVRREGPNRRCESYCNVTDFCPFYQKTYAKPEDLPFKDSK